MIIFTITVEEVEKGILVDTDSRTEPKGEGCTPGEFAAGKHIHAKIKDIGNGMLSQCNGMTAEGSSAQFLADQLRGEKKDVDIPP